LFWFGCFGVVKKFEKLISNWNKKKKIIDILFKFAYNPPEDIYGTDGVAIKAAGQEMKGKTKKILKMK